MRLRLVTTTLAATLALAGVAAADHDDDRKGPQAHGADAAKCEPACSVWVPGHYEDRECSRVIPAITRQKWVPQTCQEVVIPAVTERVRIPAVTERVYRPAVTERVWVPECRERVWVSARWDTRTDDCCRTISVWLPAHFEIRVASAGHYETRVVRPACYEERIVRPECWETRIVQPERRETRVIEQGHFETVVVQAERREVTVEHVWVPGRWETRPAPAAWIPPGHRRD